MHVKILKRVIQITHIAKQTTNTVITITHHSVLNPYDIFAYLSLLLIANAAISFQLDKLD
jgi:hypothetical protein